MYHICLTKTAEKAIKHLSIAQPAIARRVAAVIDLLAKAPTSGVPLKGEFKGCWKYRVGSYRIIYQVRHAELVIVIIDIGHRREVYR